jgi:hypothetical protein
MNLTNAIRVPTLVTVAALSLLACNDALHATAEAKGNDPTPKPAAETATATATATANAPFERALAVAPERVMTYAGLRLAVTKAVISNRTPDEVLPAGSPPALADVTLSITNASKDAVRVENARWELKLADGTKYHQPFSDVVNSRDTHERRISFPVPLAAQWTGATLLLDEKDKEPATLALDGAVTPSAYPLQLPIGATATTKGPAMTYTILAANEDLDAPGERAPLGKRCLHLSVRVTDNEPESPDQFLPEFFRFNVDGAPYVAEHMSENGVIASHSSQELTMSLLVPASALIGELEVGKPSIQQTAKIPLGLKAAKS